MASQNTHYKVEVSAEERNECFKWFEDRMDRLPASLQISCINMPDLRSSVNRMIVILRAQMPRSNVHNGQFAVLQYIREVLQKEYQL